MTSNNRTNKAIPTILFNSSANKISDYRDRRRNIDQQQEQKHTHFGHQKQLQRNRLSPTTETVIETQSIESNDSNHDVDEEQQLYERAVASLGPYDIICGRGSVAFNNIGNRRFRILIGMNTGRYSNCEGRYRKGQFIGDLVNTFQYEMGATFFKVQDNQLIELTERQIRQKVGHALRDVLAFQESQNQQRRQLREQQNIENNKIRKSQSIAKSKPQIIGNTSVMSLSQAALSSIQSRLTELQSKSDAIDLQDHDIPPPSPQASLTPDSSAIAFSQDTSHMLDCVNRDGYRSQEVVAVSHPITILAGKDYSFETSPDSTSTDGSNESATASARPYRHNLRNEMDQQKCLLSGDVNWASKNPASNANKSKYYLDCSKNDNTFNRKHSISHDPLEDNDFTPIPIDEYQEQNNEHIEMFQF